jgi:hypothetical protein
MLSKAVGNTGLFSLSSTTGTFVATTTEVGDLLGLPQKILPACKVRIAVTGQPALVNFGSKIANNNSDILIPPGHVEHFAINTSTITFVEVAGGGANGWISITPVA